MSTVAVRVRAGEESGGGLMSQDGAKALEEERWRGEGDPGRVLQQCYRRHSGFRVWGLGFRVYVFGFSGVESRVEEKDKVLGDSNRDMPQLNIERVLTKFWVTTMVSSRLSTAEGSQRV
jgi:hypothetical protein